MNCGCEFRIGDDFSERVPFILFCDRAALHKGDHIAHGQGEDDETGQSFGYRLCWKGTDNGVSA